jgi:cytochrome c
MLKNVCVSLAVAGSMLVGTALAADLKPGDDFAAFEAYTKEKGYMPPCTTCHKLDVKVVGPSYQDVAAKRKADAEKDKEGTVKMLAEKIMKGNAGSPIVYGGTPMTPNAMVKEDEAKLIAEWVLSLSK